MGVLGAEDGGLETESWWMSLSLSEVLLLLEVLLPEVLDVDRVDLLTGVVCAPIVCCMYGVEVCLSSLGDLIFSRPSVGICMSCSWMMKGRKKECLGMRRYEEEEGWKGCGDERGGKEKEKEKEKAIGICVFLVVRSLSLWLSLPRLLTPSHFVLL